MNKVKLPETLIITLLASSYASILSANHTKTQILTSKNSNPATACYEEGPQNKLIHHVLPTNIHVYKDNQPEKNTISIEGNNYDGWICLRQRIEPPFWSNIIGSGTYGSSTEKMWISEYFVKIKMQRISLNLNV